MMTNPRVEQLLWRYIRKHALKLGAGIFLAFVSTGITLVVPLVVQQVLDSLANSSDFLVPISILAVALVTSTAVGWAETVLLGQIGERIVLTARISLIERLFWGKLAHVQSFRAGDLVARVTGDTVLLRAATTTSIVEFAEGAVTVVGAISLMAILDWLLLLATLGALAIIGSALYVVIPKIGKAQKLAQDALGELGTHIEGGIRAIRTVKACCGEGVEILRANESATQSAFHSMRVIRLSALASAVAGGGIQFLTVAILGLGAWRVGTGALTISALVAFLLYTFSLAGSINSLAAAASSLQSGLAAVDRMKEIDQLEIEMTTSPVAVLKCDDNPSLGITFHDVSVAYPGATTSALSNVSFEVPPRGHTALVGLTGAGKTTALALLLRFIDPDSGSLELNGVPFDQVSISSVRSRMAYVEQDAPIIPGKIRDNLCLGLSDVTEQDMWDALDKVRLGNWVRSLTTGLDTFVTDTQLSGGERQRLAIARALVRRADILLLDEATAQLDGVTEAAIQEVIAEAASRGPVITIAHRLSTVLNADQIVLLDGGHVRDIGSHDELDSRDSLYRDFISALRIRTVEPQPGDITKSV